MRSADNAHLDFASLDPDLILSTAERAGFPITGQFQQLNSLENRVFALSVEPGAAQIVLKFYRPQRWSLAQIAEEHGFLADLAADAFPVCSPLNLAPITCATTSLPTVGKAGDYFFAAWNRSAGRIPDEFNAAMLQSFGSQLARMHEIGARRPAPARQRLNADTFIRGPLDFLRQGNFLPPSLRDRYFSIARDAADALDRELERMPTQRIHGDCHWGNLLAQGDNLYFLDFDDFVVGPAVQDLWMIAPAIDPLGIQQRELVLEGYRRVRPFDNAWLNAIGPLRAARYVYYAAWIARRYQDESFPRAFPHFGSAEYWESETKDLELLVREGFPQEFLEEKAYEPEEDYSKLTNKDYFYDL